MAPPRNGKDPGLSAEAPIDQYITFRITREACDRIDALRQALFEHHNRLPAPVRAVLTEMRSGRTGVTRSAACGVASELLVRVIGGRFERDSKGDLRVVLDETEAVSDNE